MYWIYIFGIAIIFCLLTVFSWWREKILIDAGILPLVENTTEKDIKALARKGYYVWAIKRYRQLNKCSLPEAKRRIDEM